MFDNIKFISLDFVNKMISYVTNTNISTYNFSYKFENEIYKFN